VEQGSQHRHNYFSYCNIGTIISHTVQLTCWDLLKPRLIPALVRCRVGSHRGHLVLKGSPATIHIVRVVTDSDILKRQHTQLQRRTKLETQSSTFRNELLLALVRFMHEGDLNNIYEFVPYLTENTLRLETA
jgi:hypothetical protein